MSVSSVNLLQLALPHVEGTQDLYVRGAYSVEQGSIVVPVEGNVSLGTWFNAAPLAWWGQIFERASATVRVEAQGMLRVCAVLRDGSPQVLEQVEVSGEWSRSFAELNAYRFVWIELQGTADAGALLSCYQWDVFPAAPVPAEHVAGERGADIRITAVVPTFKREDDALDQVEYLLSEQGLAYVGRVVLIDQGGTIRAHERTASLLAQHNDRFVLLEQGNFGGSGGYARGMRESLRWADDYVLLLDDDAHIDIESLRRAFEISRSSATSTIVGTGLVSAETQVDLEALAERVDARNFQWGAADAVVDGVDLARSTPDSWSALDPEADSDYCGWWGCLLPAGTVKDLGLPAPFFIKWDDAEYGLRATNSGYQVRAIPGVSVWHPTWASKQTSASWSSWMMHRNRFAVAAAYGAGRGVIKDSLIHQIKHVLSAQYDTANLWELALNEFAQGPQWLSVDMVNARDRAQDQINRFSVRLGQPVQGLTSREYSKFDFVRAIAALVLPTAVRGTERVVTAADYTWRTSVGVQQVRVVDAESGQNTRVLAQSSTIGRAQISRVLKQHFKLATNWTSLQGLYTQTKLRGSEVWEQLLP